MARAIVLTPEGAVLLMEMAFPWYEAPVWIAPGGGLAAGESAEQALRRELEEEVGRADLPIGAEVFERSFRVEHAGRVVHAHERYFLVEVEQHFEPRTDRLEAHERAWFRTFRWWRTGELEAAEARTSPESLPKLLDELRARQTVRRG